MDDRASASVATFFGPPERRCFGWLHLPAAAGARDLGVVLCKPFGYEAICAHASLRALAEALCAAGFPVLRFDAFATGDSLGTPDDPALVEQWIEGIRAAAGELRRASGATRTSLFGLRLGATLALFAADREPVHSLVLWSPFRTGKLFVREAKAFQALQDHPGPRLEDGAVELAGFPLRAETIEELAALDLDALGRCSAVHALLLGRDDLTEGTRLDEKLASLGVQLQRSGAPGYAAMMRDANDSQVPALAIAAIRAHLESLAAPGSLQRGLAAPRPASEPARLRAGDRDVVEQPIQFGPEGRLFGVLTLPSPPREPPAPAVLFLNVGANHHVGPNRMYVVQARALAARGIASLRFDVSGLGDSPPAPGERANRLHSPGAIADTRAALDLVARSAGARKAALVGLCSGAYLAFHTTNEEPRVAGQALLNQQTFFWREGDSLELARQRSVKAASVYKRAILHPGTWLRLLRGEIQVRLIAGSFLRRFGTLLGQQGKSLASFLSGRGWESSEVARLFQRALGQGTQVLLVFGDADGGIDVMEQHLGAGARKVRRRPGFRLEIVAGADHTFTPIWSQKKLEQLLIEWVEQLPG